MATLHAAIEFDSVRRLSASARPLSVVSKAQEPPILVAASHHSSISEPPVVVETSNFQRRRTSILLIIQVASVLFTCSIINGLIVVGIPHISADVGLDPSLVYWPVLVYTLVPASLLLLSGAIANVMGSKLVNLAGIVCLAIFTLSCGLARTGQQLIAFRALAGVGPALALPTAVSLVSTNVPSGKLRNFGFACLGVGQVMGFGVGLFLGGVFVSTIGWRSGFYICSGMMAALFLLGLKVLPADKNRPGIIAAFKKLREDVDWVGLTMASSSLALIAFVLAQISTDFHSIEKPWIIALLIISVLLIPACGVWFHFQEKWGRPALIRNTLWKSLPFSTVCVMVMVGQAVCNSMELLSSLFFQEVQGFDAIQASLRVLPSVVVGGILNFTTGLLVDRFPALWLVLGSSLLSATGPLLMALINPHWPYWWDAFPAQITFPLCIDVLFTVGLLVISEVFPETDQALAGAVFNVMSQLGQAMGVAIIGAISNAITAGDAADASDRVAALLKGYRAGFWTAFAWLIATCALGAFGLQKVGKVGLKRD